MNTLCAVTVLKLTSNLRFLRKMTASGCSRTRRVNSKTKRTQLPLFRKNTRKHRKILVLAAAPLILTKDRTTFSCAIPARTHAENVGALPQGRERKKEKTTLKGDKTETP